MFEPYSTCVTDYIHKGEPCPHHPVESAAIVAAMQQVVRDLTVKTIKKLARQLLDDELVLSESEIR